MIKWTTELINLVAGILSLVLVLAVGAMIAASWRRDRRSRAGFQANLKAIEDNYRASLGLTPKAPPPPPEN